MSSPELDMHQIKHAMRTAWMAGDFGIVAKTISGAADSFVDRLPLSPSLKVLDIACGTGNLSLPIARAGAQVTGVDIATNLLEQARERAAAESLSIVFDEGDAEQLPYADASFDLVVSMFGAMFAPRPELVASELARVLKPGGLLAMANWNPESFSGRMFGVGAKHAPPPPGIAASVLWGDETVVKKRLERDFHDIQTRLVPIDFDLPVNPEGAVAFFRKFFGPTAMAFAGLDDAGKEAFAAELTDLWTAHNVSPSPATNTLVANEYLEVVAIRN